MTKAIFPGTFDPVTKGHMDIIERASKIVDRLTVLVVYNSAKKTIFSFEERVNHLEYLTDGLKNVSVACWSGLTVEYAMKAGANVIFRGIRNGTDYDYEAQIAEANKKEAPEIETVFISSTPEFSYLSSTIVKEFFNYGGNVDAMVHKYIKEKLDEKIR